MHLIFLVLFQLVFINVDSYPVGNTPDSPNSEFRDEKRYPNGTIIGKYRYQDEGGNPIQVKYFADDSSYGVELKSVKVLNDKPRTTSSLINNESKTKHSAKVERSDDTDFIQPMIYPKELYGNKEKNRYSMNYVNEKNNKYYNKKNKKINSDFEILTQSELNSPSQCDGEDKLKVYYGSERKTRSITTMDVDQVCNLFH